MLPCGCERQCTGALEKRVVDGGMFPLDCFYGGSQCDDNERSPAPSPLLL